MTQEEKELLLKDLCGRLPYGVKGVVIHYDEETNEPSNVIGVCRGINYLAQVEFFYLDMEGAFNRFPIEDFKPYLRSMSSMTEEERKEVNSIIFKYSKHSEYFTFSYNARGIIYNGNDNCCCINIGDSTIDGLIDWLNAHHFDYRELIEKGLAIEVTKENNPYKE